MSTILDHILGFFKIHQTKVQDDGNETHTVTRFWPRRLGYTSGHDICNDEEEGEEAICDHMICEESENDHEEPCESCEDERGDRGVDGDEECPCEPTRAARKMKCLGRAAKYGMKEGALCGIFFGGGWGIYKWLEGNYLGKEGGDGGGGGSEEGGESDGEGGSTTNTNLIFVTAANSAIAMGVVCTFICCTKAIIYCN